MKRLKRASETSEVDGKEPQCGVVLRKIRRSIGFSSFRPFNSFAESPSGDSASRPFGLRDPLQSILITQVNT